MAVGSGSGQAALIVSGGTLTNTSYMNMGSAAGESGTVLVNGGVVSDVTLVIANEATSSGTATISSGSWLNSGSVEVGNRAVGVFNIQGGLVTTGSNAIIGNTDSGPAPSSGTVNMSSGTWNITALLVIGTTSGSGALNLTGGVITDPNALVGSGSSSGGLYTGVATITGGTWESGFSVIVGANNSVGTLNIGGTGVLTLRGGTMELGNGTGSQGTLNIGGGTLVAGMVTTGSGTGIVNFVNTGTVTFAPQIAGSTRVNQTGTGTTILTGTSTYTGSEPAGERRHACSRRQRFPPVWRQLSAATLSGYGSVGAISGAGLVAPGGNSILTATHLDPRSGMSFDFHFSQAGSPTYSNATASGNDVLQLTGATPFSFALTSANTVTLDFTGQLLQTGQTYYGGIFTDSPIANSEVDNATFDYTGLDGATVQFEGMAPVTSATFATGTVANGDVMEFGVTQGTPVPTAPAWALLAMGAGLLIAARRRIKA